MASRFPLLRSSTCDSFRWREMMSAARSGKPAIIEVSQLGTGWVGLVLFLLLLLFVLPLTGSAYWMYLQTAREIENRELTGDLVRARTIAAIVDKDLSAAANILTSIAGRQTLRHDWQQRNLPSVER